MISTNSIILTVIAFYIITSYLIFYNVHSRIEKVIDEEFHIPQGLAYCNFNFSAWDPKITTLPGLYILSTIILGPLRLCSTFWLRFVNYIVGVINLCLLIILFGGFNKNANERQRLSALLSGFNLAILPPLFFFTNLYYTDVVSLMFIILLMVFNKQNKHGLASFCGLLSVIARQTNIIWVAMMSGDYILRQFYRWCIKTKPNRKLLDRISKEDVQSLRMDNLWDLLNVRNVPKQVLVNCCAYLSVVSDMESAASTSEEVRSSSTGPSSVSSATATNCNSGSSRHSPKIPVSIVPSPAASLLQRNTSSPSVPKKIMSKNHNNTVFPTTFPSNLAELQLYRVMQNASLLYYYDTLLEMGGDDVQQLCDAGEEEFLEIMSLVGMASKPLHVRRLQKSLQEWVTNPAKFKLPPVPGEDFEIELSSPRVSGSYYSLDCSDSNRSLYSPSPAESLPPVTSPGLSLNRRPYSPLDTTSCPPSSSSSPGNTGSLHVTPTLLESQISKLAAAAERLSKHLPQFEPKPHNAKKKMCKELELVMSMPETDPRRMDEIRRYAAIYGRFDCKRRPEKPLTLHEVSVNEAAAQICRFVPALLTRRDELFPLARQVVKDSGCHYSKIQYTSILIHKNSHQDREVLDMICSGRNSTRISLSDVDGLPTSKRQKMDGDGENEEQGLKRQDKAADDLITSRPHLNVLFHHSKSLQSRDSVGRSSSLVTDDETDSHFSYSNSSSPCQVSMQDQDSYGAENTCQGMLEEHQTDTDDSNKLSPKVQVIAASGDNIIAVANPALAMSPAILPLTLESREHSKMVDQ